MITAGVLAACGREADMAARVTLARAHHEVRPTAYQPRRGANGEPSLALDLFVLNRGRERLRSLTLQVVVVDANGKDRAAKRVTVDTSGLLPGVASQLTAVVEGLEVREGETVLVELENEVPESERGQFPEYAEGVS
ncbi:MAG: hypothetical protein HXY19_06395 [Thermoanaerobaculaceae bacterium]|nr:hypothetical protein [Thermoanaerobaculaceae bacterium]